MTDKARLSELMQELDRVGVDPEGFPAGFAMSDTDALHVLRDLPDNAGPMAFLARIRIERSASAPQRAPEPSA